MKTRIIRLPEVISRTGLSRSSIYLRIAKGDFPRPVPLGGCSVGRAVGWVESEIEQWLADKIETRRAGAPCPSE